MVREGVSWLSIYTLFGFEREERRVPERVLVARDYLRRCMQRFSLCGPVR